MQLKYCSTCRTERPLSDFGSNPHSKDKLEYRCRPCNAERRRRTGRQNAEKWSTGDDPYVAHATGQKVCYQCKQDKPVLDYARNSHAPDGLQGTCRICQLERFQVAKYGRTLAEGSPSCEICGRTEGLGVDHCHKTGKPRGNLCRACNTALGSFGDSPQLLRAAAQYIERWKPQE